MNWAAKEIETFFKILKSGCKIEQLQLICAKRYSPCLALYLIYCLANFLFNVI